MFNNKKSHGAVIYLKKNLFSRHLNFVQLRSMVMWS